MRFVHVPTAISSTELCREDFCFSPGRYVRFIPPEAGNAVVFHPLDRLVTVRNASVKVSRGAACRYAEIGDIDIDTGGIVFHRLRGFELPTTNLQRVERGDVFVSTVRTYRKGIGVVTDSTGGDLVATKAVLVLGGVTDAVPGLKLPYVYSFLRTDFFVEQVWSLLHRGVYPRMDTGALGRILLPVPTDPRVTAYVSALAEAITDKERAIRERNNAILREINRELAQKQSSTSFAYSYPALAEVRSRGRLDAAIYSSEYKSKMWKITNYGRGSRTPTAAGFSVTPGPSLEIKLLRTRIDSDVPKPGFYRLLIPANISEYGTMSKITYLGTGKRLPLLKKGDILFGEAGFGKGRSVVLIDDLDDCTTNAHGLYARRMDGNLDESIFFRCIFHWYRSVGLIDLMAVGGSGGHFSPEYFDNLLIPCFPEDVKSRIVSLYHSPAAPSAAPLSISNYAAHHRMRNARLGLWQLDVEMKCLQGELAAIQELILSDEYVKVDLPD